MPAPSQPKWRNGVASPLRAAGVEEHVESVEILDAIAEDAICLPPDQEVLIQ
jgi:hypothetical protein